MRFNKGSASINKFSPLPKIEEVANTADEKEDPVVVPQVPEPEPPAPSKETPNTAAKQDC